MMTEARELPDDNVFRTVEKIGRAKHDFFKFKAWKNLPPAWVKKPIVYQSDPHALAHALTISGLLEGIDETRGLVLCDYTDDKFISRLMNAIELSVHWFKYETDEDGNTKSTNKIDWIKEAKARNGS
jgi:hypothetical protein